MAGSAWLAMLPTFFALLQAWISHRVTLQVPPGPIFDGIHFIIQARAIQDGAVPLSKILEHGLYTALLSLFDLDGVVDWSVASAHPKILGVYAAQTLLLAATTALFLFFALKLIAGPVAKRTIIVMILGLLLLSPLVVVWPSFVLTEAVTLSALLLLLGACLSYDKQRRNALAQIALACCLLILVRDPMIFFVWILVLLLALNLLCVSRLWTPKIVFAAALLLAPLGLGIAKALVVADGPKTYSQLMANIIQLRILPDSERRKFFVERGLPATAAVMERAGKPAWHKNSWFMRDEELRHEPDFIAYRAWVLQKGVMTYAAFLLTHPGYLLRSVFHTPNVNTDIHHSDYRFSLADLLSVPYLRGYYIEAIPYAAWLKQLLLAPIGWVACLVYLSATAVRFVLKTAKRQSVSAVETIAIAALGGIIVSYHTDALDLWRHAAPLLLVIYVSFAIRVADIGEDLFMSARHRDGDRAAANSA